MIEPIVRFPGGAKRFLNLPEFVEKFIGHKLITVGDDYVISSDDPQIRFGPRPAVSMHSPLQLRNRSRHALAGALMRYIPGKMNKYFETNATRVTWDTFEESELIRVYKFSTNVSVAPLQDVRGILRDEVLPFMITEAGAVCVCPITIDADLQQACYSLAKLGLFADEHEPAAAERLSRARKVYRGVVPNALDLLSYVSALTRCCPIALTLPVQRADCAWHFVLKRAFSVGHMRSISFFEMFHDSIDPLSARSSSVCLPDLVGLNHHEICEFIALVVEAINNMMSLLNSLTNFVDDNTLEPDFSTQLQAYCAVNLIFAEMVGMGRSAHGFQRVKGAMAVIDKLANLRKALGPCAVSEEQLFKEAFANKERKRLSGIVANNVQQADLRELILRMIRNAYERLHQHYSVDMGPCGQDEDARLGRIRIQRNLHHGAFLRGDQFHKAFGTSTGEAADEITAVAWLSVLCFALAPAAYLGRGAAHAY